MEMKFYRRAYDEMIPTVGSLPAETGGILLGDRDDYIVKKFIFDENGSSRSAGYDPDIDFINQEIKREWEQNGLALIGFLHSHPRGVSRLSGDWGNNTGDIGYIKAIFKAIPSMEKFLVPIIYSTYDGGERKIFPYVAMSGKEEEYEKYQLTIIDEPQVSNAPSGGQGEQKKNSG